MKKLTVPLVALGLIAAGWSAAAMPAHAVTSPPGCTDVNPPSPASCFFATGLGNSVTINGASAAPATLEVWCNGTFKGGLPLGPGLPPGPKTVPTQGPLCELRLISYSATNAAWGSALENPA